MHRQIPLLDRQVNLRHARARCTAAQVPAIAQGYVFNPLTLNLWPERADILQKQDRRRAQNRTAQRAYRERKEKLLHELELQVKTWQERHQSLRDSYVDQAQEVQQLKEHVQSLQVQLLTIQATEPSNDQTFCDFDLWPHELAWKTV